MTFAEKFSLPFDRAICYSGYRTGQAPGKAYPSYEEIKEDLLILKGQWGYLRLYDCTPHAVTVLEVIQRENLDFKVLLGAHIAAEVNNPNCPWGGVYSEEELESNKAKNRDEVQRQISLANQYKDIVLDRKPKLIMKNAL